MKEKTEEYITNNRQLELIDLAENGYPAAAIRLAIREAVDSVYENVAREMESRKNLCRCQYEVLDISRELAVYDFLEEWARNKI